MIGLGVVMPIVLLSALFIYSDIFVIKSTAAPDPKSTQRTIQIVGYQWFWEARYPGTRAVTANDIHIPAGVARARRGDGRPTSSTASGCRG